MRATRAGERRVNRRLEELIDLLWQTDEMRVARPDVVDEARNVVYYFDELHRDAVPARAGGAVRGALTFELELSSRPPAQLRQLDRRRSRRQSNVGPEGMMGCSTSSTSTRSASALAVIDEPARGPVLLGAHHRRHVGAGGIARPGPRGAARARRHATGA